MNTRGEIREMLRKHTTIDSIFKKLLCKVLQTFLAIQVFPMSNRRCVAATNCFQRNIRVHVFTRERVDKFESMNTVPTTTSKLVYHSSTELFAREAQQLPMVILSE